MLKLKYNENTRIHEEIRISAVKKVNYLEFNFISTNQFFKNKFNHNIQNLILFKIGKKILLFLKKNYFKYKIDIPNGNYLIN